MKTGVQCFYNYLKFLDSGFRRNDDHKAFSTFYDFIKKAFECVWFSDDLGLRVLAIFFELCLLISMRYALCAMRLAVFC